MYINKIRNGLLLFVSLYLCLNGYAQKDSLNTLAKPNVFDLLEKEKEATEKVKQKTNFEHWMYGQKKHALVGYYGAMFQVGFNNETSTYNLNHDLGVFYKGKFVQTKKYKLTVEAWVEQNSFWAGKPDKVFSKELGMFSAANDSDETEHSIGLEYLYIENLFFNGFLDISLGKMDPLFLTAFATYSGWDRYTFFSKTMASNPVPPLDPGFGFFTELNFNQYLSVGGIITDDNPQNEIIDPVNFFSNTNYAFEAFVRFAFPSSKKLYSYHSAAYYYVQPRDTLAQAKGFTYVGNQDITENIILTIKVSSGVDRILKYNAAYSLGAIWLHPFNRVGDQFGFSGQINEKAGKHEYGIDTYYKIYIKPWMTCSANLQLYYSSTKKINAIPGLRAMLTY